MESIDYSIFLSFCIVSQHFGNHEYIKLLSHFTHKQWIHEISGYVYSIGIPRIISKRPIFERALLQSYRGVSILILKYGNQEKP